MSTHEDSENVDVSGEGEVTEGGTASPVAGDIPQEGSNGPEESSQEITEDNATQTQETAEETANETGDPPQESTEETANETEEPPQESTEEKGEETTDASTDDQISVSAPGDGVPQESSNISENAPLKEEDEEGSQKSKPPTPQQAGTPARSPTPQQTGTPARTPTPQQQTGTPPRTPTPQQAGTPARTPTPQKAGTPQRTPTPKAPTPTRSSTPQSPMPGEEKPMTPGQRVPTAPELPPTKTESPKPNTPENIDSEEYKPGPNAMNLVWSFGMNRSVPLLNMTDDSRKMVMYACAHTGVLYDLESNTQKLLQGHSNAISCTCVSEDKRWIVTADKGDDGVVIIWDSNTGVPVRTMFEPHTDGGVVAMAITGDAKYLATLSAADNEEHVQTLSIWDWTNGEDAPMASVEIDPQYGLQTYILFNPEDQKQLVSNNDNQVIFYAIHNGELGYFAPPLTDHDFNKPVGRYSQSVFQSNSSRALTATSVGNLVVWDTNKPYAKLDGSESPADKKALKLVKIQDRGFNVLTTTRNLIVSGDSQGHVKFFDQTLKLVNWYQDFDYGPINSLSFEFIPEFESKGRIVARYPNDATIAAKKFVIRDFAVGTTNAVYAYITADGTKIKIIHQDHDAAVHALAAHPSESKIVVGSYSGLLKIWDYQNKVVVASRIFDRGYLIQCCAYDPKGEYLAVGFVNGCVRIIDALTLQDEIQEPFRYSRDAVTKLAFSQDSKYLAVADADFSMTVFRQVNQPEPWVYLGRNRAHYKLIRDVLFGVQLDSEKPRLLSLGEDRMLVEYDLEHSTKDNLMVLNTDRIEQSAVPQCMTWYPPITKEQFLCTANDQFKFKLYNSTTKMCRKTLLGPTYGTPLQKIEVLPTADEVNDKRYMAYITVDKVGLHILPLEGNPHDAMALIAHPAGVTNLACSFDGKFVFTAGGSDSTVHMWDVNPDVIEAQSRLGGPELIPFYGLLEGGRDGELFAELEDYFYYAQIRSQGVDTMETREVSTNISISEVPFVMRAMGYYPSEQEVQDMLNEIKFSKYVETGQFVDKIDLGEFIRLYVNHRPAFGLSPEKLKWAFDVLGLKDDQDTAAIDRGDLLDILQSRGEHMTEYELAEYLTTLLGFNPEGGSSELQDFDPSTAADVLDANLPAEISAEMFANEVLGLSMYTTDVLNVAGEQSVVMAT